MSLPLAITSYDISLWIHISAAVVGLGATFAEAVLFPVAMKMGPRNLPFVHRVQIVINRYFAGPALLLIILTGIYQVIDRDWEFGAFWISATFAIAIILGGINGAYFIPTDRKLGAMVEKEIADAGDGPVTLSKEYLDATRVEGIMGAITGLLVILAVFFMVTKLGA